MRIVVLDQSVLLQQAAEDFVPPERKVVTVALDNLEREVPRHMTRSTMRSVTRNHRPNAAERDGLGAVRDGTSTGTLIQRRRVAQNGSGVSRGGHRKVTVRSP